MNRSLAQRGNAHVIARRLAGQLARMDLYIPIKGASGKMDIPSFLSSPDELSYSESKSHIPEK